MTAVVDSSLLIDFLSGLPAPDVARTVAEGRLVLPPLVVAEVVTGAHTAAKQEAIFELLQDTPTHSTDLLHWLEVPLRVSE